MLAASITLLTTTSCRQFTALRWPKHFSLVVLFVDTDLFYADTMVVAMDRARSSASHKRKPSEEEEEEENSYIDLETSVYSDSFSKVQTSLAEELNCSKRFEELLESELGHRTLDTSSAIAATSEITNNSTSGEIETASLEELIVSEKQKCKEFEDYLRLGLEQGCSEFVGYEKSNLCCSL